MNKLWLYLGVVASVVVGSLAPSGMQQLAGNASDPAPKDVGAHSHSSLASAPLFELPSDPATGDPKAEVISAKGGLTVIAHHTGEASWEPTVGVTEAEDHIFATAWRSSIEPRVLRSTDRGATWTDVSPGAAGAGGQTVSSDPYLFTDADKVFSLDAYALTCGRMSVSADEGETWVTNPVACGTVVSDHPSAFAGKPVSSATIGHPNVIYVCDFRPFGLRSTVYCSKSLNGGLLFLPTGDPAFPVSGSDPCTSLSGHGAAGPDGTIYMPRVTPCGPELSLSADEGATWKLAKIPQGPGTSGDHEASVTVDRQGNIFYMWMGEDRLPYLTVSADHGRTFSTPRMVAPRGVKEANLPASTINHRGEIALAYVGSTNSPPLTSESPQPCPNTATECPASEAYRAVTWNGYVTVLSDPASPNPHLITRTINKTKEPIDNEACGPGRCYSLGDFIDITSGADGTFWASFVDGCNGKDCVDSYGGELVVVEIRQL